jgi:hypothetical protein
LASWIFQGNPKVFDIDRYLTNHRIILWAVNQKQFIKRIQIGDDVYLWRSISPKHSDGGIIGHGIIIDKPELYPADELTQYYYDLSRSGAKLRARISIDSIQLEPPKITRQFIKNDSILSKLSILKFANATNFDLNKEQANRLYELYFGMEGALESTGEQDAAEFPEGRTAYVLHRKRERSALLTKQAKLLAIKKIGMLSCKVCGFNFHKTYGNIGEGFIEAHHIISVCQLKENSVTRIEDIVLVCSNCHRMLHRRRPWLSENDLSKLIIRQNGA